MLLQPYKLRETLGRSTVKQQKSHQDRNQGVSNFAIPSQLWPQIQNTLGLKAHLAFRDSGTETHPICSECDFTGQRNTVFQKQIFLSDLEGDFEP